MPRQVLSPCATDPCLSEPTLEGSRWPSHTNRLEECFPCKSSISGTPSHLMQKGSDDNRAHGRPMTTAMDRKLLEALLGKDHRATARMRHRSSLSQRPATGGRNATLLRLPKHRPRKSETAPTRALQTVTCCISSQATEVRGCVTVTTTRLAHAPPVGQVFASLTFKFLQACIRSIARSTARSTAAPRTQGSLALPQATTICPSRLRLQVKAAGRRAAESSTTTSSTCKALVSSTFTDTQASETPAKPADLHPTSICPPNSIDGPQTRTPTPTS